MEMTLKVDPAVLISKANEISAQKAGIMDVMDQVKTKFTSLQGLWQSDSSTEFQSRFQQVYDDIDNVFIILTEHVNDLTEAAQIYIQTSDTIKAKVETLPVNGVFR